MACSRVSLRTVELGYWMVKYFRACQATSSLVCEGFVRKKERIVQLFEIILNTAIKVGAVPAACVFGLCCFSTEFCVEIF
jgi:hypothetical protein